MNTDEEKRETSQDTATRDAAFRSFVRRLAVSLDVLLSVQPSYPENC
jgi:hypothetical protein